MNRDKIYELAEKSLDLELESRDVDYWLAGLKLCKSLIMEALNFKAAKIEKAAHWAGTLAACIACMMQNGVIRRGMGPVRERIVVSGAGTFKDAIFAVNGERAYQDAARGREYTEFGLAVLFDTHLRRAFDAWTDHPGDFHALDEIRKLAGICVYCLEKCY